MSDYDPVTGICWRFGNKGDQAWRCRCPAHAASAKERRLVGFGRCRSGRRWFWVARVLVEDGPRVYGWVDTEDAAVAAAVAAVPELRVPGQPAIASVWHDIAQGELKKVNAAKRAARPAANTKDPQPTEYLFSQCGYYCDMQGEVSWVLAFPIVKKSAKRVYYRRSGEEWPFREGGRKGHLYENEIGFVDRVELETKGCARKRGRQNWCADDQELALQPPSLIDDDKIPDLHQLKSEMAAAHPDRGGTSADFIAARERYLAARRSYSSSV